MRFPPVLYAVAFSRWKRPIVQEYCQGSAVRFVGSADDAPEGATLLVWGRADGREKRPTIRVEDAFLRSVGLGADLIRPLSWVMDGRGMYYDATAPSDLEHLLQNIDCSDDLLQRAQRLRQCIVGHGLTKYNVGTSRWRRPEGASRVILVPGQVESDASIQYGTGAIRSNIGLLRAVREAHPAAYVVYKPHPDVLAGLRMKGRGEEEATRWCDEVVTDSAMGELLAAVDEVHVLTSLTGFEALLRDKKVTCYGQPFYAGWGLTYDLIPHPRRTRRLTLDELVTGTLILYPTYVSRTTGKFTTAETVLDELINWRKQQRPNAFMWPKFLHLALVLRKQFASYCS
jgi:capsular polysaccharide export protein